MHYLVFSAYLEKITLVHAGLGALIAREAAT
jgi:hypothetical protein